MPQPYDYRLNLPNPAQNLINTVAAGQGIQQLRAGQQKAQAAQNYQQRLQADLQQLGPNPSAAGLAKMMVRYPELSEQFQRTYKALSQEEQKAKVDQASQVYAALQADQPQMAYETLQTQAEAYRNAGREREAKTLEDLAELTRISPETAKTSTGLFLASAMGPDQFTETFTKLQRERREQQLQPSELTKAQAEAQKAAVAADFAESDAAIDLEKKGWDIWAMQQDAQIKKDNQKIAALKAELAREKNQIERQKLQQQLDEAKRKREQELREKTAQIETMALGIDNSLNTIDRLLKNPELDNVIGALEGARFYPSTIAAILNPLADADRRADATADIETVQGQQFIENLMNAKERGATFGSLTEREGMKLEGYIRSLKTRQSEKQFRNNLTEIQRLLLKSRSQMADKYGVPESIPDRPNVEPEPEVPQGDLPVVGGSTEGFRVLGVE